MVPLLKIAIDDFALKEQTISNGFKACGLYLWNPDAIDYLKCLGVSNKNFSNNLSTLTNANEKNETTSITDVDTITFATFTRIVGPNLLDEIQASTLDIRHEIKSPEFLILCNLFKELKKINLIISSNHLLIKS